jgi:undecaprenyl diphosphate synthase
MSIKLDMTKIPLHIAIILDGNGRWAKERGMPREYGHKRGFKSLLNVAKYCNELGVKCLTVYAFSTENWNRPEKEVSFLMSIPSMFISERKEILNDTDVKINFIGRKDRFPKETLDAINEIMEKTKDNKGMKLNIAFDYGSKNELVTACKEIVLLVKDEKIEISDINENLIESHLFTKEDPKLDLLIRTSGEIRISNFLLWQLSYSELYFTERYWPDFNKLELYRAIKSFQNRNRRFGGLK